MTSKEVIRKLEEDGWFHVRSKGDHFQYKHPEKPGLVTVKHPTKDLGVELLKSMEKQSGIKLRD